MNAKKAIQKPQMASFTVENIFALDSLPNFLDDVGERVTVIGFVSVASESFVEACIVVLGNIERVSVKGAVERCENSYCGSSE